MGGGAAEAEPGDRGARRQPVLPHLIGRHLALNLLTDVPQDYRDRLEAWKVRSPVAKFNAALTAAVDRRAGC
jgi:hypothetical protein